VTLMQLPRFRAITKVYACSSWHHAGSEFDCYEWPQPDMGEMEPVNVEAERVIAYQREHRHARGFPNKLMRDDGSIFLPAHPGCHVSWRNPAPAETSPQAGMPRYMTQAHTVLGGVVHRDADLIVFLGWPNALSLLPQNEIAKKISAYETAAGDHVDFPHAPWCCVRNAPFLPDLNGVDLAPVLAPYRQPPLRARMVKASRARGAVPPVSAA
jgi:hypothetical protein